MRFANAFAAALILLAGFVGTAAAQVEVEEATFAEHIYVDFGTGLRYTPKGGYVTQLAGDVYNNTNPRPTTLGGLSSTDLNAQWGDRVTTTGTGILQENDFTVYNPGTSGGPLLTATYNIALFNGATSALLGSYNVGLNFGAGLNPGFFSTVTVTGLGGLNVNLNTTDIVMIQQSLARTGTATRLGIVSMDPPTIGSSTTQMYINATTVGPAGFYTVAGAPNPGYRINVSQPVPTTPTSWGAIKAIYKN
jgi:hypothetical protein